MHGHLNLRDAILLRIDTFTEGKAYNLTKRRGVSSPACYSHDGEHVVIRRRAQHNK